MPYGNSCPLYNETCTNDHKLENLVLFNYFTFIKGYGIIKYCSQKIYYN